MVKCRRKDMGEITLEEIYKEVRSIKEMLEEFMEKSLINVLPEEEIDEKEWKELEEIREENEYLPLKEVKKHE